MKSSLADFLHISPDVFHWVVLPFLIFLARIFDVSISTVRMMLMVNGKRNLAPFLGFFEALIWLIAIGQILQNIDSPASYIAYALGFATGIYVGMWIEEKLAYGKVIVRIITPKDAQELLDVLKKQGYGLTNVPAEGAFGRVNLIFTVVNRNNLKPLLAIITAFNPKTFYTIESVRYVSQSGAGSEITETAGLPSWWMRIKGK